MLFDNRQVWLDANQEYNSSANIQVHIAVLAAGDGKARGLLVAEASAVIEDIALRCRYDELVADMPFLKGLMQYSFDGCVCVLAACRNTAINEADAVLVLGAVLQNRLYIRTVAVRQGRVKYRTNPAVGDLAPDVFRSDRLRRREDDIAHGKNDA